MRRIWHKAIALGSRLLVVLAAGGIAVSALAAPAGAKHYRAYKEPRAEIRSAPVKDCTRFNGRFGYYGNPWCTPREQAAWDAYTSRR